MPINFPDSPSVNDLHNSSGKTWQWNGTTWTLLNISPPSSIVAENIASSAITAAKIASNAVTEAKINDGAVTQNKLASGLSGITVTTTALRDSVITSPFNGQFAFMTDTQALQRWNGSSWVSAITTVPTAAPTSLALVSATTTTATISFNPGADGGSAITNYQYALSTNGGSTFGEYTALSPADGTSPITIAGLISGVSYQVKLKAVNALGTGSSESSAFSFATPLEAQVLVVGGGGSGGVYGGGGGGGGVAYASAITVTRASTYTITIGGGSAGKAPNTTALTGSPSSAFGQTCGGGGDAGRYNNYAAGGGVNNGGAGAYQNSATANGTAPTAASGFVVYGGYAGGAGNFTGADYPGGGGGGAGGNGGNSPNTSTAGAGANGIQNSITGTNLYWAAGGGGGKFSLSEGTGGSGGLGGGGGGGDDGLGGGSALNAGANANTSTGTGGAGGQNTGSGGGGTTWTNQQFSGLGGNGGSGVVIIRHSSEVTASATTGSPTVTTSGGYRIYTFTGSGSITW